MSRQKFFNFSIFGPKKIEIKAKRKSHDINHFLFD